jgi:two-component system NtrC family response regulator
MLDEIGDLPLPLQAKLLRFLQERVIDRVGGREEIPIDVRVVCATHQDLKSLIREGRFREDLYYRLAEIVVSIPSLRERPGDAALLAHAFVQRFAAEQRRGSMTLRPDAVAAIEAQPWSGNVRELENCMRRAVIMAEGNKITAADLGFEAAARVINRRSICARSRRSGKACRHHGARPGEPERGQGGGNAGVSRPTLYDLMRRFALK